MTDVDALFEDEGQIVKHAELLRLGDDVIQRYLSAWVKEKLSVLRSADPARDGLIRQTARLVICDKASQVCAEKYLNALADFENETKDHIKPVKAFFDAEHAKVCAIEKSELLPIATARVELRGRLAAYCKQVQDAIAAENKRKADEAMAIARKNREAEIAAQREAVRVAAAAAAAAKEANDKKALELAKTAKAQANANLDVLADRPLEVAPVEILEQPKSGLRENWEAEITDFSLIPQAVKDEVLQSEKGFDLLQKFLKDKAKKLKQRFNIPGARAYEGAPTITAKR